MDRNVTDKRIKKVNSGETHVVTAAKGRIKEKVNKRMYLNN